MFIATMSSSASSRLAWLVIQLLILFPLGVALARQAPQNLVDFYNAVRAKGNCFHQLATGFYSRDRGPNSESIPPHESPTIHSPTLQPFATAPTPSPPRL
jgi:hypothetical protein